MIRLAREPRLPPTLRGFRPYENGWVCEIDVLAKTRSRAATLQAYGNTSRALTSELMTVMHSAYRAPPPPLLVFMRLSYSDIDPDSDFDSNFDFDSDFQSDSDSDACFGLTDSMGLFPC